MSDPFLYEYHLPAPIRQRTVDPDAVLLYCQGRCTFVTHGSDAETDLLTRGAIHIGRLRFDPHPTSATAAVIPLSPERAALEWGSNRN